MLTFYKTKLLENYLVSHKEFSTNFLHTISHPNPLLLKTRLIKETTIFTKPQP